MSTTLQDKARRRSSSSHRRNNSGELDVFEAESYFSAASEPVPPKRQGRASLDIPMLMKHNNLPKQILLDTIKPIKETKKHKQPSSPGGKLATFFNSLLNQTKKKSSKSVKDVVESDSPGGWRRRRRSSISHFTTPASSTNTKTTMSEYDYKSTKLVSGFRTPPPHVIYAPIRPYKEFKTSFSSYSSNIAPAKLQVNVYPVNGSNRCEVDYTTKSAGLDQQKMQVRAGLEKRTNWVDRVNVEASQDNRGFKRFMEEDGAESDSSSDLFELQLNPHHQQLGYCANDLPVYETTRLDTIKLSSGTPITNGPFRV